jgi:hypothetical protein
MPRIRRHRTEPLDARSSSRRGRGRRQSLELTPEQRQYLVRHGFGPDTPGADFADPAVRARFVAALQSSGVLRTGAPLPRAVPQPLRRAG